NKVMSEAILEKINKSIADLKREATILRSFLIGIAGKDEEGEYKPEFVKQVLKSAKSDQSFTFDKADFLQKIHL
ncbi:MAG: hypothetical protein Q8N55_00820, partial [bacterium]|nr:hypothetical protein [bacterium]